MLRAVVDRLTDGTQCRAIGGNREAAAEEQTTYVHECGEDLEALVVAVQLFPWVCQSDKHIWRSDHKTLGERGAH
jgi:hypothetical protein